MRSGSHALCALAVPLNVHVLQSLDEAPLSLPDLRRTLGHPPVTTMRSYLRKLTELRVIERHREIDFPGSVSYAITRPGKKLVEVLEVLQGWLEDAPEGPVELGSIASKSAIKALVDGWDAGLVRALAARPLGLTELNRLISQLSYPALERRLTAMRQVGLVEPEPQRTDRVSRCRITQWHRLAVAPLAAAAAWECEFIPEDVSPPGRLDAEAAFLLGVPLLNLSPEVEGVCRLAVEFRRGSDREFAGVTVAIQEGQVQSCVTGIEEEPDAWASGSVVAWVNWLRGSESHRVEIGGDQGLVRDLREGFGRALVSPVKR